jgi:hypothetical protein
MGSHAGFSVKSGRTDTKGFIIKQAIQHFPFSDKLLYLPNLSKFVYNFFLSMAQQPLVGQGLLIIEASRSHSDAPHSVGQPLVGQDLLIIEVSRSHSDASHSVGLPWTSDQPDAQTSAWQHTTLPKHRHPRPGRYSNLQSQHASGRRPTP